MKTKLVENSSQVSEIGYDEKEKIFLVVYKTGAKYHYYNIEPEIWEGAQSAESVGSYIHQHVKTHSYKRV